MGFLHRFRRYIALETIVNRYNRLMNEASACTSAEERMHFCGGTYQGFRSFLALVPDERAFVKQTLIHRERVLTSLTNDIDRTAELVQVGLMPSGILSGMIASHLHCAALCWQEIELAAKIADELAPYVADGKIEVDAER